jgi:hypothetical protein
MKLDLTDFDLGCEDSSIEASKNFRRWSGVSYVSHDSEKLTVRVHYVEMIMGHRDHDSYVTDLDRKRLPYKLQQILLDMDNQNLCNPSVPSD